jgi:hypothetical protein
MNEYGLIILAGAVIALIILKVKWNKNKKKNEIQS